MHRIARRAVEEGVGLPVGVPPPPPAGPAACRPEPSAPPVASGGAAVRSYGEPDPGVGLLPVVRFRAVASPYPWMLQEHEFVRDAVYEAALRETYFDGTARRVESSRTTPQRPLEIPLGAWMLDDFRGIHGREISQLRLLDPKTLLLSEDTGGGKLADVERYALWMTEGRAAPPIVVVETWERNLKVVNGHRRTLAAKATGRPVLAWVGPLAVIKGGVRTGLTLEIARGDGWDRQAFPWGGAGAVPRH